MEDHLATALRALGGARELSASERKAGVRRAVEVHILGPVALGVQDGSGGAPTPLDPRDAFEAAITAVTVAADGAVSHDVRAAKAWLKEQGPDGLLAAGMLGKLSSSRNTVCHPKLWRFYGHLDRAKDHSAGEGKQDDKNAKPHKQDNKKKDKTDQAENEVESVRPGDGGKYDEGKQGAQAADVYKPWGLDAKAADDERHTTIQCLTTQIEHMSAKSAQVEQEIAAWQSKCSALEDEVGTLHSELTKVQADKASGRPEVQAGATKARDQIARITTMQNVKHKAKQRDAMHKVFTAWNAELRLQVLRELCS